MFDNVSTAEPKEVMEMAPWQFQNYKYNDPTVTESEQYCENIWDEDGPFTQTDLINTEEMRVQELIYQIRKTAFINNSREIADKLSMLVDAEKEEEPISSYISVDSLKSFYVFLLKHTALTSPIISLTPDLDIYVSWRLGKKVFSVHFLQSGEVCFVLFKPNRKNPDQKIRISGKASIDTLIETVSPQNVDWIFE